MAESGLNFAFISLTDKAAYRTEVSRFDSNISIQNISVFDTAVYQSIVHIDNHDTNGFINFLRDSFKVNHTSKIVISLPTNWGFVDYFPSHGLTSGPDIKSINRELATLASLAHPGDFNFNFVNKDDKGYWCFGINKKIADNLKAQFKELDPAAVIIVLDTILYHTYYETLDNKSGTTYLSFNGPFIDCWHLNSMNNTNEWRFIPTNNLDGSLTVKANLLDFVNQNMKDDPGSVCEIRYMSNGQGLENLKIIEEDSSTKIHNIPIPTIDVTSVSSLNHFDNEFINDILVKIDSASSLIL